MKIALINKSDSTGGAAVVTHRLMNALRDAGHDARLFVAEKLTDSPHVVTVAPDWKIKIPFFAERLDVARANGFDRNSLFSMDPASRGLGLARLQGIRDADAILLNWTNQGLLSLKGLAEIARLGKPVIQTMHDMWAFTGICHHAGECTRYMRECGHCPLLGRRADENDLSRRVWKEKKEVYDLFPNISFVAVSNWLAEKARSSSLLSARNITVIPNAFSPASLPPRTLSTHSRNNPRAKTPVTILFGAARLDDPIKGLPVLLEALRIVRDLRPDLEFRMLTFGASKDPHAFDECPVPVTHLGTIHGEGNVADVYAAADIVVSASRFETLPGTLVEAQAYGCIPVAFDRGGQRDIIDHGKTGWLADRPDDGCLSANALAKAISEAADALRDPANLNALRSRMARSVATRFSPNAVAGAYLQKISDSDY